MCVEKERKKKERERESERGVPRALQVRVPCAVECGRTCHQSLMLPTKRRARWWRWWQMKIMIKMVVLMVVVGEAR